MEEWKKLTDPQVAWIAFFLIAACKFDGAVAVLACLAIYLIRADSN